MFYMIAVNLIVFIFTAIKINFIMGKKTNFNRKVYVRKRIEFNTGIIA
jgi:hypothetical protein